MTTPQTDRAGRGPDRGPPTARAERLRHPWTLVARREVATKLVDRTFLVGTLLTLALIVGFVVVQARALRAGRATTTSSRPRRPRPWREAVAERAPDLDERGPGHRRPGAGRRRRARPR